MIVAVEVGVATTRPPRHHATVFVVVEAEHETEALLVACQMAGCHPAVVMPVCSAVVEILAV